tara:strand:+ start:4317 stop:4424 length:108 start_codon:yes stop_codon:yes gene_type:complete
MRLAYRFNNLSEGATLWSKEVLAVIETLFVRAVQF